jgi:hypothetical protein
MDAVEGYGERVAVRHVKLGRPEAGETAFSAGVTGYELAEHSK